ncbi:MAG: hypothetical protein O9325_18085 [Roseomonas sp.]|nr:hypothetical protein [Roseomonas sp.]
MRWRAPRRHGLRFSEEVRAGEDFLHYFECVAHGARFVVTPAAYYVYRLRPGSITFRPSSTFYNSAANRRMVAVARRNGAPQAVMDALAGGRSCMISTAWPRRPPMGRC